MKKKCNHVRFWMLTKLIAVIISQYTHISNHYVVHSTYTMMYVNYISIKLKKISFSTKGNMTSVTNIRADLT